MRSFRPALFVFLVSAVTLLAQTSTTSVRGTVTDPSGALVPNAQISLTNTADNSVTNGNSDKSGLYSFPQLVPATYLITVNAPGFAPSSKQAQLLVNQPATINFQLGVQAMQTVNVSAEAQTLNKTDASIGDALDNQVLQALPTEGRNVPDLLSLQPGVLYLGRGVSKDSDSRTGAVAGARSDQGNVTLDGLDDNDQTEGYAFTGVLRSTIDSTDEFRVATVNSDAAAGRSSGAQVSLVTKSGTNSFHGDAFEYYRPSFTVANNWFNKQAQLANGLPNVPGKLIRNTFGGAIGGPIFKNKLFFFFNYEGQRSAENTQETRTVPTDSYRAGMLKYLDNSSDTGNVRTLSPAQFTQIDTPCVAAGGCPNGPGPNPNVLQYFSLFPHANTGGGDNLNTAGFTFSSPSPSTLNTSILKFDYNLHDKHHLFIRGNLQKDVTAQAEQFPGQGPSSTRIDNTKGLAAGDTWTLSSSLINDLRYGYIRQGYADAGTLTQDYVSFRFMNNINPQTSTTIVNVPVHNIIDNATWTHGNHTFQGGVNWRLIGNNRFTNANSFNSASTNPYWIGSDIPDPAAANGYSVNEGFGNSYLIAYANLAGTVPELDNSYNYAVNPDGLSGSQLADAATIAHRYRANEFEWFLQDSWRPLPNLTLTFGLRHTILQTPYDTHGQQVSPNVDVDKWYKQREISAQQGQTYEPLVSFSPSGPAVGRPGYWPKQKLNFAPRFSVAYSPDSKTSIRAGFGMYYDHFGQGIVDSFTDTGSFGLSTVLENPAGAYNWSTSPRFTGINNLPNINVGTPPPNPIAFPYTVPGGSYPDGAFLITWGLNNRIKTPYSESIDASVQRLLPGGLTLETSYVGRMGRHLMQQQDFASPTNFVDPQGGGDYYSAARQLSVLSDRSQGMADPENATVAPIPYFEHMFPQLAGGGNSATQNIYTEEWEPNRYSSGETFALADLDFYCNYGCPQGTRFYQTQFSSLFGWDSIGQSYYNAGQIVLRHPSSHGLQADFSYTFSKSIDMGSDTQRAGIHTANNTSSVILNAWNPEYNRAPSDFDTRHLITANFVDQLPIGRGQHFAGNSNGLVNSIIGGWQLSALTRWTSGLPFSLFSPAWPTNWEQESFVVQTGAVKMRKHIGPDGLPQVFDNPDAITGGAKSGSPIRLSYAGEAGQRNNYRGDGYFDIDSSLRKTWTLYRENSLSFAWDVFNATNSVRFDTTTLDSTLTDAGTMGEYQTRTLNLPRVMQFSLRYGF
ncbi:MAG: TonB-dependent receptor [Acidobacteriaceae bacterium]